MINLVRYSGGKDNPCWNDDLINTLVHVCHDLGEEVTVSETLEKKALNIVFSVELMPGDVVRQVRNHNTVIYQGGSLSFDRLHTSPKWLLDAFRAAQGVWDYSVSNVSFLSRFGIRADYVPPQWHPCQENKVVAKFRKQKHTPILMYGSMSYRRRYLAQQLEPHGIRYHYKRLWGDRRARLVGRSLLILHTHFYDRMATPKIRISWLLANKMAVVAEEGTDDPYGDGIVSVPYDRLAITCRLLLADDWKLSLEEVADLGHRKYKALPMIKNVAEVLKRYEH